MVLDILNKDALIEQEAEWCWADGTEKKTSEKFV